MEAPHVHRGNPAVALEAQLSDELVGPSGDDGLSRRMPGRMVVQTPLRATFRVAAGPDADIHGVHCGVVLFKGVGGDELSEGFGVHRSLAQCRVETTPAATVRRLEAQVGWGGDNTGRKYGVGKFEECISAAMEAFVESAAELAQGIEVMRRLHDASFCYR